MGIESQHVYLDVEREKKRVELEKAFENFEENPIARGIKCRSIGQSTPKKKSTMPRKSVGYFPQDCDLSLNIEDEKERVEVMGSFQNFQERPSTKCTRAQSVESYEVEIGKGTNAKENASEISIDEVITINEKRDGLICTSFSDGISEKRIIMGDEFQDVSTGLLVEKRKLGKSENGGTVEEIKGDVRMSCQNTDASGDYESTYSFMEFDVKSSNVQKAISSTPIVEKKLSENKGSSVEVKDVISEKCLETMRSLPSKTNLQIEAMQEECYEGKVDNVSVNTPIEKEKKARLGRKGSKASNNLRETDVTPIIVENKNESESLTNSSEKISTTTNENSRNRRIGKTLQSVDKTNTKERKTGNDSIKITQDQQEHELEEKIVHNLSTKIQSENEVILTKEKSSLTEISGLDSKPVLRQRGRLRNNKTVTTSTVADTEQEVMPLEGERSKVGISQIKRIRRKADKENFVESEAVNLVSNVDLRSRQKVIENSQKAENIDFITKKNKVSRKNSEKVAQDAKQNETSMENSETKSNCGDTLEIAILQNNKRNARKPRKVGFKLEEEELLEVNDNRIINVEIPNKIINYPEKTEELLHEVNNSAEATTKRKGRSRLDNTEEKQIAEKRIPPKNSHGSVIDPSNSFESNISKEEGKANTLDREQLQRVQRKEEVTSTCEVEIVSKSQKSELLELESDPIIKTKKRGRSRKTNIKQITSKSNETQEKKSVQIEEQIGAALENENNSKVVKNLRGRRNKIEVDNIVKIPDKFECNVTEEEDEIIQINSDPERIEQNKGQSDFTESKKADTRKTRNVKKTIKAEVKDDLEGDDEIQSVETETQTIRENRDSIEIKRRRGRRGRRVEVKEEVIKDSPVTRSLRSRRGDQQKLTILQDTSQANSKNLEIKEESVNEEVKKVPISIRKRGKNDTTERSIETSNTSGPSAADKQRRDALLLSETEDEEIPRKKRVVGRKHSNKENVCFEDVLIEKIDEPKSKSGVHTLRSRTRHKENNLLEISADELTPIKPTTNAHKENVHISTPIAEQSNVIEFKTPVNVVQRARRCLRSNSTTMSTPKLNGTQEQLSRQNLSKPEINESTESKNKSEKEMPTFRKGRRRLNSTKEDVSNGETDDKQTKGENEVGTLRTRAGRRKKEVESDVNARENQQGKKSRRNANEKEKNVSVVHVVDFDEEKLNNKTSKNQSEKINKNIYNASEESIGSKENQVEEPTADKAVSTRSTKGKRKIVEADISKGTEEVPVKRTTRSRRK